MTHKTLAELGEELLAGSLYYENPAAAQEALRTMPDEHKYVCLFAAALQATLLIQQQSAQHSALLARILVAITPIPPDTASATIIADARLKCWRKFKPAGKRVRDLQDPPEPAPVAVRPSIVKTSEHKITAAALQYLPPGMVAILRRAEISTFEQVTAANLELQYGCGDSTQYRILQWAAANMQQLIAAEAAAAAALVVTALSAEPVVALLPPS